jgi:hypothetical protein
VVLGKTEELGREDLQKADVHIRLQDIDGTLFVECESPWSPLYAVTPGMTAGNPMMQLDPVV